jgi:putative PIN family toxin of toxin-antitoxin system
MLFVLDTSTLIVSALSPNGGAAKLVQYARDSRLHIALSPKLYDELETRLTTRERFRRYLTVEQAHDYVDAIALFAQWFEDRPDDELPQICRDPDDNFVLALYQDTDAVMLVSNDRDILDLQYPNVIVRDPGRALAAIDYQHEWGGEFLPGDFAESLLQVEAEGSSSILAAYSTFVQIVNARAMDILPFIVVPETLSAFVQGFEQVRAVLQNRGLTTRPHFASPEIAYLKLPPDPGQNLQVATAAPLPTNTIFATMQHCPDLEDPPGLDLGHWRVWGIGGIVEPQRIVPRQRPAGS